MVENTVLIVDDNVNIVSSFKRMTKREPYKVYIARSGFEALAVMEKERIDILITDEMMPVMRGSELIKQVKALLTSPLVQLLNPASRVIVLVWLI